MNIIVVAALALWIVTKVITSEIAFTAMMPKPISCQLCLSGWICMTIGVIAWQIWHLGLMAFLAALAIWALTVLIGTVHRKLNVFIL